MLLRIDYQIYCIYLHLFCLPRLKGILLYFKLAISAEISELFFLSQIQPKRFLTEIKFNKIYCTSDLMKHFAGTLNWYHKNRSLSFENAIRSEIMRLGSLCSNFLL